jgi:hypothetical protein
MHSVARATVIHVNRTQATVHANLALPISLLQYREWTVPAHQYHGATVPESGYAVHTQLQCLAPLPLLQYSAYTWIGPTWSLGCYNSFVECWYYDQNTQEKLSLDLLQARKHIVLWSWNCDKETNTPKRYLSKYLFLFNEACYVYRDGACKTSIPIWLRAKFVW